MLAEHFSAFKDTLQVKIIKGTDAKILVERYAKDY
jgi:hypothetical protein